MVSKLAATTVDGDVRSSKNVTEIGLRVVSMGTQGVPPCVLVPIRAPPEDAAKALDIEIFVILRKSCVVVAEPGVVVDERTVSVITLPV